MADSEVLAIANKVVGKLPSDKKQIGILAMIEIGLILLKLVRKCRNPQSALEVARRPNLLQRIALRREVRRGIKISNIDENKQAIVKALLDFGQDVTTEDITTLMSKAAR